MEFPPRRARLLLGMLAAATVGYAVLPSADGAGLIYYDAVAIVAVVFAFLGIAHHRPQQRRSWVLVVSGFSGWVAGDLLFTLEQNVWRFEFYPLPSDSIYLSAYGLLAAGTLIMVRTRRPVPDRTALLDATIVATGAAVLAAVFLIAPLTADSELTIFGKVVSSAYPIGDILLIAVFVRMWAAPGARTSSYRLLLSALGMTLAGDVALNVFVQVNGTLADRTSGVLYLASYVTVAGAAWAPSMRTLAEPAPDRADPTSSRRRLAVLAAGLMLPAVALLLDGVGGDGVLWPVIGAGSLVISALVLTRMSGIVRTVEVQAAQLSTLARLDELTGAPNRRTWDHELMRACAASRERGTALCLAIVDLDHFKQFNDTRGHQAGDLLLRETVAAWTEQLGPDTFLARYGGDEFTVLLPGVDLSVAQGRIKGLQAVTPHGQTISAGVSRWDPSTEPAAAVAAADLALYEAKRAGRDRVVAYGAGATTVAQPPVPLLTAELATEHDPHPAATIPGRFRSPTEVIGPGRP